ncbi:antitoxin PaaA2 family protein, partial [Escherichia coli]
TRPDRAEALKRAHEAAAYDAWFREQVQAAIDDPRPALSHEEAKSLFAARKKALLKGD